MGWNVKRLDHMFEGREGDGPLGPGSGSIAVKPEISE
jgi:hypothetical protein